MPIPCHWQVLFALAIFFVAAHATELSMSEQVRQILGRTHFVLRTWPSCTHLQLAQSNAENARLRTENKDLRSHLGTADDENARLRAENMDLRSQLGMTAVNDESAANVDDVPMLANDASTLDEFLDMNSEWSGVVGAGVKYSRWMLKWIVKKYSWLFSATFNRRVRVPRGRPLKQEKCLPIKGTDAYKGFVKEDCSLTEIGINCTKNSIEYVGTPGRPKWNVCLLACNGAIIRCMQTHSGLTHARPHTDYGWFRERNR